MNGLITFTTASSTISSRQWIASIASGVCLLGGFFLGSHVTLSLPTFSFPFESPFEKHTLDFSKISWVTEEFYEKKIPLTPASPEYPHPMDLVFTPYQMPVKVGKIRPLKQGLRVPQSLGMKRLQEVAQDLRNLDPGLFDDYQNAVEHIRYQFQSATYRVSPSEPPVRVASSNGDIASKLELPFRDPIKKTPRTEVFAVALIPHQESVKVKSTVRKSAPVLATNKNTSLPLASIVGVTFPEAKKPLNIQKLNNQTFQETIKQTLSSSEEVKAQVVGVNVGATVKLTQKERTSLSKAILNAQVKNNLSNQKIAQFSKTPVLEIEKQKSETAGFLPNSNADGGDGFVDEDDLDTDEDSATVQTEKQPICPVLANHNFLKPTYANKVAVDTHVCPNKKEWLSKSWQEKGWVKVESSESLPTLTYHPAPNHGDTLLLDQNALALMALTTGVHIAKGTGVIMGLVPKGFKVEFSGRGEETHYFDSNLSKYFAILNAEPGVGVVQLISEQNQNLNSTVFVPVLENTVSYLDLAAPVTTSIPVQVMKNNLKNDPETTGLTVGIATQGGIQAEENIRAITQADGTTVLKNVSLVPGFPVYLDLSSKFEEEKSYTYRYELRRKNKNGYYVLHQVADRSLYRWLRQEKQGISGQSAMVVGFYDRKKLKGFKAEYTVQTEAKTARYGMEPRTYSILWDGKISATDPLEGDKPRFMSIQVPEGLIQTRLLDENHEMVRADIIPVSPRVIHVISE